MTLIQRKRLIVVQILEPHITPILETFRVILDPVFDNGNIHFGLVSTRPLYVSVLSTHAHLIRSNAYFNSPIIRPIDSPIRSDSCRGIASHFAIRDIPA